MEPFLQSTGYSPGKNFSDEKSEMSGQETSSGSIQVKESVTRQPKTETPFGLAASRSTSNGGAASSSVPCAHVTWVAPSVSSANAKSMMDQKMVIKSTEETVEVSSESGIASKASNAARLPLAKKVLQKMREMELNRLKRLNQVIEQEMAVRQAEIEIVELEVKLSSGGSKRTSRASRSECGSPTANVDPYLD